MGAQQLEPVPAEGVDPSVRPHVRPRAAVLAQLEMVLVGGISMLPDKHQFVLAPVETAHSGPCCTDRSLGGEDWTVYQGPVPDPGQPPCHSKRTKIAVITSRSSGTE